MSNVRETTTYHQGRQMLFDDPDQRSSLVSSWLMTIIRWQKRIYIEDIEHGSKGIENKKQTGYENFGSSLERKKEKKTKFSCSWLTNYWHSIDQSRKWHTKDENKNIRLRTTVDQVLSLKTIDCTVGIGCAHGLDSIPHQLWIALDNSKEIVFENFLINSKIVACLTSHR